MTPPLSPSPTLPSPCQPWPQPTAGQPHPPAPPGLPRDLWGRCCDPAGRNDSTHTCARPHGDPQPTAPPWGTDPAQGLGGGPHSRGTVLSPFRPPQVPPGSVPSPAAAPRSPSPAQATSHNTTTYMYIYTTKPQNTRYIKFQRGDAPIRTVQGTHYSGGGGRRASKRAPPTPPSSYHPPPPPQHGGDSPDKGTLQGTAQTQPRGQGGTGLGGPDGADWGPTNLHGRRRPVGRYRTGQTNKQMAEGGGRARGTPMTPAPPQASSQPQAGVRATGLDWDDPTDEEGGESGTPHALSGDRTPAGRDGEDPQLCGGRLPPRGSRGHSQKDLLPHPQPARGCSHWVGAPESGGLQVPPAKPPGGILQQLYPQGGGTGATSLASPPWSQSFSCARLSSVMPWAASSARTLSR